MSFLFEEGGILMADARACAYSYLYETSSLCDYEIATDLLASRIGLAMHDVKHSDLKFLVELVYHANGSMRGKCAITEEDLKMCNDLYEDYLEKVGSCKMFVLPCGCRGASVLHCLRSETKSIIRILAKIDCEPNRVKNKNIHQFFNLLSNLFFLMALYENKQENVKESEFVSKSYEC